MNEKPKLTRQEYEYLWKDKSLEELLVNYRELNIPKDRRAETSDATIITAAEELWKRRPWRGDGPTLRELMINLMFVASPHGGEDCPFCESNREFVGRMPDDLDLHGLMSVVEKIRGCVKCGGTGRVAK